ncbi:MAG: UDP-2,3-diacylglucosamine diphosphatase [Chitinophagaceae bacterium]|nr:UDP-2,3-diacylglucosamine diphosphatase [Chitinophagaceae bacterium]
MKEILFLETDKKIYFASDFHLIFEKTTKREEKIIRWLEHIESDAGAIFLVGDIFDFWFEYKYVIPKGFISLQSKIKNLVQKKIPIYFFTGNHDMWMSDYFVKELGVKIYKQNQVFVCGDKQIFIGHGDGIGPNDFVYKCLKKIFQNTICQFFFRCLHPDIGMSIANAWSQKSREKNGEKNTFMGEKEWILSFCKEEEKKNHNDFYIFGHRHLPIHTDVADTSQYINIGDWITHFSYAVFDGEKVKLFYFNK